MSESHQTLRRALGILGVLQTGEAHDAASLALRVEVTPRTIRRDVSRLRDLGYPIQAVHGAGGGYRLGSGGRLPPLLLDEAEALATAVSLRLAADGTIDSVAEAAVSALSKIVQSMPHAAREQAAALAGATSSVPSSSPSVSGRILVTLSTAVRRSTQVRFDYARRGGERHARRAEPYGLVSLHSRWYLMAWDLDRADWRTFRLDRMSDVRASTFPFTPRPAPDARDFVQEGVAKSAFENVVELRVFAPAERLRASIPPVFGTVEPEGEDCCRVTIGTSDPAATPFWVAAINEDFEVIAPLELKAALAATGERLVRAAAR